MPHPARINDVKSASEEKTARLFHLRLNFTHRKVFEGYVFVNGRIVVNFGDDTFGYYTNAMAVLSTLKRLTTTLQLAVYFSNCA